MVDPELPYATPDLIAAIGDVTGAKTEADRARQHIEVYFALSKMLAQGSLKPGDYPLLNVRGEHIHVMMRGYFEDDSPANDMPLGRTPEGQFRMTGEHLKLRDNCTTARSGFERRHRLARRNNTCRECLRDLLSRWPRTISGSRWPRARRAYCCSTLKPVLI